jgi:hypothetical protein
MHNPYTARPPYTSNRALLTGHHSLHCWFRVRLSSSKSFRIALKSAPIGFSTAGGTSTANAVGGSLPDTGASQLRYERIDSITSDLGQPENTMTGLDISHGLAGTLRSLSLSSSGLSTSDFIGKFEENSASLTMTTGGKLPKVTEKMSYRVSKYCRGSPATRRHGGPKAGGSRLFDASSRELFKPSAEFRRQKQLVLDTIDCPRTFGDFGVR